MTNEVLTAIAKRSSARAYDGRMITDEELDAVIKAGLMAPTATNRQEIHFSVVKGDNPILDELDSEMKSLRGMPKEGDNFYHGAPVLIIISAEEGFKWSKVDAGITVQNMAVAAQSVGLGSLIIGCIYDAMHGQKRQHFDSALQIPEGYVFEVALAVGYKTDDKAPHTFEYDKQVSNI